MSRSWSILYRGPLSSCNYDCGYCPFAKRQATRAELENDRSCLERFVKWAKAREEELGILFTPWGEALVHRFYQSALSELSHAKNIRRVAIQTNLSCALDWIRNANRQTLALWCTFHPGQVSLQAFLGKCHQLDANGLRYSVGIVGTRDALPYLEPLRAGLDPRVYVWVNAFKRDPAYYAVEELSRLSQFDPLFPMNNQRHPSFGRACRTGHSVFSVDGDGAMRRCHFVPEIIGNIYDSGFESALRQRACSAPTCGCHIGYVHLEELGLDRVFGDGLLERIPARLPA